MRPRRGSFDGGLDTTFSPLLVTRSGPEYFNDIFKSVGSHKLTVCLQLLGMSGISLLEIEEKCHPI